MIGIRALRLTPRLELGNHPRPFSTCVIKPGGIHAIRSQQDLISLFREKAANRKLVLQFKAAWCGPCKRLQPDVETLAENYSKDDIVFGQVDVEAAPDVAIQAQVKTLPTFLFFSRSGKEATQKNGDPLRFSSSDLQQLVRSLQTLKELN